MLRVCVVWWCRRVVHALHAEFLCVLVECAHTHTHTHINMLSQDLIFILSQPFAQVCVWVITEYGSVCSLCVACVCACVCEWQADNGLSVEATSLCPCVVSSEKGRPGENHEPRQRVLWRQISLFIANCFLFKKSFLEGSRWVIYRQSLKQGRVYISELPIKHVFLQQKSMTMRPRD